MIQKATTRVTTNPLRFYRFYKKSIGIEPKIHPFAGGGVAAAAALQCPGGPNICNFWDFFSTRESLLSQSPTPFSIPVALALKKKKKKNKPPPAGKDFVFFLQ
jgi:hypothetical protein